MSPLGEETLAALERLEKKIVNSPIAAKAWYAMGEYNQALLNAAPALIAAARREAELGKVTLAEPRVSDADAAKWPKLPSNVSDARVQFIVDLYAQWQRYPILSEEHKAADHNIRGGAVGIARDLLTALATSEAQRLAETQRAEAAEAKLRIFQERK